MTLVGRRDDADTDTDADVDAAADFEEVVEDYKDLEDDLTDGVEEDLEQDDPAVRVLVEDPGSGTGVDGSDAGSTGYPTFVWAEETAETTPSESSEPVGASVSAASSTSTAVEMRRPAQVSVRETSDIGVAQSSGLRAQLDYLLERYDPKFLIGVVVVFAAVLAIVGLLLASGGGPASSNTGGTEGDQSLAQALPGTVVLGTWSGKGDRTITPKPYTPPAKTEIAVTITCTGDGPVGVDSVTLTGCGGSVTGTVSDPSTLRVTAPADTTWTFSLVRQPGTYTNGTLVSLPNPLLDETSPDALASHEATGSASVSVPAADGNTAPADVEVVLTCSSDNPTVTFSVGGASDRYYTYSCFQGWSYEFDLPQLRLPQTIEVKSNPDTHWRMVVVRRS
ncbi:MAG: hypothetical protein INR72_19105 [Williamsia herbipolensis]|nr:hypothetical protein [Williamsia herbipolensis]